MAQKLIAPLAPNLELQPGYIVKLIAVDPTTGAAVTGVVVSNVSMQVDVQPTDEDSETPTVVVPPLFAYGTNE